MGRRKYRFKDRAEAESAFQDADTGRRYAEWLLSAMLNGTNIFVGRTARHSIGYVVLRHTLLVYAITNKHGDVHRVSGVWEASSEQLQGVINTQIRHGDDEGHELAELLELARRQAYDHCNTLMMVR